MIQLNDKTFKLNDPPFLVLHSTNNNNHTKKVEDLIRQLEKSLTKPMSDKDRLFLESKLAKLKQVR